SHDDPEQVLLALNDAKQAFHLRIAVAELESSLTVRQVQQALTAVAESLVGCCYLLAQRAVQNRYGALPTDELAVIGYGTLGAKTLGYDSDLDLIFLYQPCSELTRGAKAVESETYHTATVRRLLSYLTSATTSGRLYEVDTRLRPNGRSGLLVSSLPAFEKYQQNEAWTWELQALCRGRPVTGSQAAAKQFDEIRLQVLSASRELDGIRRQVLKMRRRMRDAHRNDDVLKHGDGGLVDIEFVAQLGLLLNGREHPQCLQHTSTQQQLEALHDISWLSSPQFEVLSETLSGLTRARHFQLLCGGRRNIKAPATGAGKVCADLLGAA
ncbi:MAG: bifunctional glutamine synthetase adenylyltransferase/deadenyltransferase, partial [Gammaproteobacteria bacterium]|nr:bifunctional glutamine synthetase adenylyltransferase/deadenyltransferase [Gammaproteobacteria bacterium]